MDIDDVMNDINVWLEAEHTDDIDDNLNELGDDEADDGNKGH